jgi:hypothetical protein
MKDKASLLAILALLTVAGAEAGNPAGPATPPSAGSGMPTLTDIYNRLATGSVVPVAPAFQEPVAGPGSGTGFTLAQIAAKLPSSDLINGATAAQVLFGRTFWGLRTDGTWGSQGGTALAGSNVTGGPGLLTFAIPDGVYTGRAATAADPNLATSNVRGGVNIFGVAGKTEVVDTTSATAAVAADVASGKQAFVNGNVVNGSALAGANVTGGNALLTFAIPNGIYTGRTATAADTNLVTGNVRAGVNIFGVAGKTEVVDTTLGATAAVAGNLATGKQAFVNGSIVSGSAAAGANVTGGNALLTFAIPNGIYAGRTATAADTNLVTGNIRAGVNIFGVAGKTEVVDTTLGGTAATAGQLANGKQAFVNGALVTGTLSGGGLTCGGTFFGPGNRWCDQGNGSILDMSSGLVWLKNITCLNGLDWTNAVMQSTLVQNGSCGLTDGSSPGDWRLPLLQEVRALAFGTDPVTCSSQAFLGLNTALTVWTLNSDPASPTTTAGTMVFNAVSCIPGFGTNTKTNTSQAMAVHRK